MRAFVIDGPKSGDVRDVPEPRPLPDEAVVDVQTVGLCGTDVELFAGTMPYFRTGLATYPLRPGHEWEGTVRQVGSDVTSIREGDRVTGDTFLGCGHCPRCRSGRHHLCETHQEIGVRGGRPGALAERLAVPVRALHTLPSTMAAGTGAFVEPGSCALRAVHAAGVRPGAATLVWGTGTLGLLAAQFARALGASVCVVGQVAGQLELAAGLGFDDVGTPDDLTGRRFDCVIEATGSAAVPGAAIDHVYPGGTISLMGVAPKPARLDAASLVLNDISVVGVLGGSAVIEQTIELLAGSAVDVQPLIATTIGMEDVATILESGGRIPGCDAPKVHVRPSSNGSVTGGWRG